MMVSDSSMENLVEKVALDIVSELANLQNSQKDPNKYLKSNLLKYSDVVDFFLEVNVRFSRALIVQNDEHFKHLSWEKINFTKNKFIIDANTMFSKKKDFPAKIEFHFVIDPTACPDVYSLIYSKLLDTVAHELHHTIQIGKNREPFNAVASSHDDRNSSKKSYKYFLLPEEVESMVVGMNNRSKESNIPLDQIFMDYLTPFVKSAYITAEECKEVMEVWVKHALESYPDAIFSHKVDKIIKNI